MGQQTGGQEIGTSEVTSGSCPQESDPFDLRSEQLEEANEIKVGITSRDSQELNTLASRDPSRVMFHVEHCARGFDAPSPKENSQEVFHVEHFRNTFGLGCSTWNTSVEDHVAKAVTRFASSGMC